MKNFLGFKVSAAADAVVDMLSAQMGPKPLVGRRIAVMRHTYEGGVLVQFQVHRLSDATTYDYGVRQAWLYCHPADHTYELYFTHRNEIIELQEMVPETRGFASILFSRRPKGAPTHPLTDILLVCEFIRDFFEGDLEEIPQHPQYDAPKVVEADMFQGVEGRNGPPGE